MGVRIARALLEACRVRSEIPTGVEGTGATAAAEDAESDGFEDSADASNQPIGLAAPIYPHPALSDFEAAT